MCCDSLTCSPSTSSTDTASESLSLRCSGGSPVQGHSSPSPKTSPFNPKTEPYTLSTALYLVQA